MNIKNRREELGKTQIECAMEVGCSLSSWRMWEAGVTKPTEENAARVKEVLNIKEE